MRDPKQMTALCCDQGLFSHVAEALAPQFRRTIYFTPWKFNAQPQSRYHQVGQGLLGVERADDLWRAAQQADVVIFPDVYTDDIRDELARQGKLVWGAGRKQAELEEDRWKTRELIKSVGLPVPSAKKVTGVRALRDVLRSLTDRWVKHSMFRGDVETFHHRSFDESLPALDKLAHDLGPIRQETADFIVEVPIADAKEIGFDGFYVDGATSATCFWGIEEKNQAFLGAVVPYKGLPKPLREGHDRFRELLRERQYRGWFSSEWRVTPAGIAYLIDPCVRCGSPPSEGYMRLFKNWAQVIVDGAQGKVRDLVPVAKCLGQVAITASRTATVVIHSEDATRPWVMLQQMFRHGRYDYVIRDEHAEAGVVGWLVALGGSVDEVVATLRKRATDVHGDGVSVDLGGLDAVLKTWNQVSRETWR